MKSVLVLGLFVVVMSGCAGTKSAPEADRRASAAGVSESNDFQKDFNVKASDWSSVGRNDYFILEPGYQHVYRGGDGELIITVLKETKTVDGVETRVIEERESAGGHLAEISRNYFAIDKATGDVYYFGEEVDVYKNDKVASHPGGWLSGVDGAHFGLFMPAKPRIGQKFYQEHAPKVAMDRCEVVSMSENVETPAGTFDHCLKMKETTPIESGSEYKTYAPKVGLLQDEDLKLVKHGIAR